MSDFLDWVGLVSVVVAGLCLISIWRHNLRRPRTPRRRYALHACALLTFVWVLLAVGNVADASTAYCLTGTMADGTPVRAQSVAHNGYPLGTRLTITPNPTGNPRWTVRDRIGHGTDLDFWVPSCAQAIAWGRRPVTVRVGWAPPPKPKVRSRARKVGGRALKPHPRAAQ